eukprot:TRINITY_DN34342_c0_g1_i1.p1 TRINITY_DN34342_c0_g1~~TRINITY_DN34342_c0_g1_i1.p1  ORF type:complete len:921 (+),score=144.94 TRINITY_DN34342_c0_g1_i1:100-2862(+)
MVVSPPTWPVSQTMASELGSAASLQNFGGGLSSAPSECAASGKGDTEAVSHLRCRGISVDAAVRCSVTSPCDTSQGCDSFSPRPLSVSLSAPVVPFASPNREATAATNESMCRRDSSARRTMRRRGRHTRGARPSSRNMTPSSKICNAGATFPTLMPESTPTLAACSLTSADVAAALVQTPHESMAASGAMADATTAIGPSPLPTPLPASDGSSAPLPPEMAHVLKADAMANERASPHVGWVSQQLSMYPSAVPLAPSTSSSSRSASPTPPEEDTQPGSGSGWQSASIRDFVASSPSSSSTARSPFVVEVSVEGQEVSMPSGIWTSDGCLDAPAGEASCKLTVKAGLAWRSVQSILCVTLIVDGPSDVPPPEDGFRRVARVRFAKTALQSWATLRVTGIEECDIAGYLGCSLSSSLSSAQKVLSRVTRAGLCHHDWCAQACLPGSETKGDLTVEEALALGPGACRADFVCGLSLRVTASCVVRQGGQVGLRVEIDGELRIRPRFRAVAREAAQRLYASAKRRFSTNVEDSVTLRECEEALALFDGLHPMPAEAGDVLNLLGALHLRRQTPAFAVTCLKRALAVRQAHLGDEDVALASTLMTLGSAHQMLGAQVDAQRVFQRAVAILDVAVAADAREQGGSTCAVTSTLHLALAKSLHSLGSAYRALGQNGDARRHYERALEVRECVMGEDHFLNATTLNNLGAVLQQMSDDRGAIRCYQRALALQARSYGEEHCTTAATLSNLGSAHARVGDHRCAIDCHRRAYEIQERLFGSEHPAVAASLHNLGNSFAPAGQGSDALRCHWRALAIWSRTLGNAHPDIAATLHSLGNIYRSLSQPEEAAKCFAGSLRIRESILGPTHPETARTRHCAGLADCAVGDHKVALSELETSSNSMASSLGASHPWSHQALSDAKTLRASIDG